MADIFGPKLTTRVQAYIDALPVTDAQKAALQAAAGAPGGTVELPGKEKRTTGSIWAVDGDGNPVVLLGVLVAMSGQELDATVIAKVNELIGAYNQLRTDYNAGTVPTSAAAVAVIA